MAVCLGMTYAALTPVVDAEEQQPRGQEREPCGPRPRVVQIGHCGHGHEADSDENAAAESEPPRSTYRCRMLGHEVIMKAAASFR